MKHYTVAFLLGLFLVTICFARTDTSVMQINDMSLVGGRPDNYLTDQTSKLTILIASMSTGDGGVLGKRSYEVFIPPGIQVNPEYIPGIASCGKTFDLHYYNTGGMPQRYQHGQDVASGNNDIEWVFKGQQHAAMVVTTVNKTSTGSWILDLANSQTDRASYLLGRCGVRNTPVTHFQLVDDWDFNRPGVAPVFDGTFLAQYSYDPSPSPENQTYRTLLFFERHDHEHSLNATVASGAAHTARVGVKTYDPKRHAMGIQDNDSRNLCLIGKSQNYAPIDTKATLTFLNTYEASGTTLGALSAFDYNQIATAAFQAFLETVPGGTYGRHILHLAPTTATTGPDFGLQTQLLSNGVQICGTDKTGNILQSRVVAQVFELGTNTTGLNPQILFGVGSPEGVVDAAKGSLYLSKTGGANVTLYVRESYISSTTGWIGK